MKLSDAWLKEIRDLSESLDEFEKVQVMCAALLHDLGHGPYSHFFESLQSISHEQRTALLILDEKSEVHQALVKAHPELPVKSCCDSPTYPSQKDVKSDDFQANWMPIGWIIYFVMRMRQERVMELFDLERILRTMRVKGKRYV